MNIELKSKIQNDKYTNYVYDTFDIQNREETSVSIPMNLDGLNSFDWNIGVIYGGSGCGKSTILNTFSTGIDHFDYDQVWSNIISNPIISTFMQDPKQQ